MLPRSLLGWAILAGLAVAVFRHPQSSAHAVAAGADRIILFFSSL